ncbi:metal ion binding [Ascochyta rabiei]|uniref:Metal ion binding n=2 Tax=Didymella rabiei TaxID=5454 RepID=A0A163HDT2_DIDRA|nr:metal ion binding [Ascochyta rabiei]
MAIPSARDQVPPPLPPPRHIEDLRAGHSDPGWQWGNTANPKQNGFGGNRLATVRPGSSLYGGSGSGQVLCPRDQSADHLSSGREPSISRSLDDMSPEGSRDHNSDEDRSGKTRPSLGNHRLTSERQLGQKALDHSSQAYDKQLLSKIGGPNTPTRTTAPPLSSSAQDPPADAYAHKLNGQQLKPLSVPDRLHPDSPAFKWPQCGAISPGYTGFRSPVFEGPDAHRARYGSISTPGPLDENPPHHRGSYDHSIFSDHEFGMEENGMRNLNIDDRSPAGSDEYHMCQKAGLKRRASSPPPEAVRDDRPTTGGNPDLYHRRSAQMLVNRNTPASRFQMHHGSLSSISSSAPRTGSVGSSLGLSTAASSMTSYGGDQRLSPSALSPSGQTELGPVSPYAASRSLNPSPRGSLSSPQHRRGYSESEHPPQVRKLSTENIIHSRQNSMANRIPGAYICECCPKKPKKFDSEDELRSHELEKQYICQYCPNRFKNKNEAERHQNSLHLRRHSWSCAALAGIQAAFHPSPTRSAAADVCGFCGEEFPNPANWDARAEHLNHVHKFGECNQAKKFFRADHFRQHLKHSHAGTSGKWTNMLENACMRDEPPPQERVGSVSSISGPSVSSLSSKPGIINEAHDES